MNIQFLWVLLLANGAFAATIQEAFAKNCRQSIVEARQALRSPLAPADFSSLDKNSFRLSARRFNSLSADEQAKIYMKLKPLAVMVDETVQEISSTINYLSRDPYASLFRAQILQNLRQSREELRNCSL